MREALATASLTLEPDKEYALWQVQEATAVLTGRHIVSDCFHQPREGRYGWELELLDPAFRAEEEARRQRRDEWLAVRGPEFSLDDAPAETREEFEALTRASPRPVALLYWLLILCQHATRRPLDQVLYRPLGWEWGEAGGFLRFRTIYPDLMRGAFLPEETLAQIKAMELPSLDGVDLSTEGSPLVSLDATVAAEAKVARPLTAVQLRVGLRLIYEDPTTPLGAARARVRAQLSEALGQAAPLLPLLSTLSRRQWEKLGASGLNCRQDLTPEQQALLQAQGLLGDGSPAETLLTAGHPAPDDPEGRPPSTITSMMFGVPGASSDEGNMWLFGPRQVSLDKPLPHLVPVPQ
jgi:hypothetical protein